MPSNTEIIRDMYERFAEGDIPAVLSNLDPDVCWTEAEGFPHGGTYIGPDNVLENVFMNLDREWEDFAARPVEFIAEREAVVTFGEYCGTFKSTGKSFRAPFVHIWNLKGFKVVQFRQLTDTVLVRSAMS